MDPTAAWAALLRVHAALTPVLDQELQAAHGLPLTWYDVLLELNAAPGRRLTMSALGAAAVVSRSRVSRVVDELVRAGLVEREANPDDKRSAYAKLTAAGRGKLRSASPTYLAGIERHFTGRMTRTEAQAVAAALGKVLRAHDASTIVPLEKGR
ncbi:MarR family winged helix-turn-helix transcriptional regulator [Dactylosporangium sp. CA-139066]|uniref:MarR family winged helix-turn-helix transcriptional regulator n=1 Tax=Dactylosporangium sp. CA-139066 TaxID=3239930 RepID=UPI003D8C7781